MLPDLLHRITCIRHAFRDSRDPLFARMIDTIVQMYEYNLIKADPWNIS